MARDETEKRQRARRLVLAAGGAAGTASLAGCTASGSENGSGSGAPPAPDEDLLGRGGWAEQSTDDRRLLEREFLGGRVTVTADAETTRYEDAALRRTLRERTLGGLDSSLALFSVARITLDPNPADLPLGVGTKEVLAEVRTRAREQFEATLADAGLSNVRETGERDLSLASGGTTTLTEFAADYEYEAMRVPLPGGKDARIDGGTIEVAGLLAVWRDGRHVVVGGGAHPASNVVESVRTELSDAITVDVDVDLGLTPEAYGEELRGLVASIE